MRRLAGKGLLVLVGLPVLFLAYLTLPFHVGQRESQTKKWAASYHWEPCDEQQQFDRIFVTRILDRVTQIIFPFYQHEISEMKRQIQFEFVPEWRSIAISAPYSWTSLRSHLLEIHHWFRWSQWIYLDSKARGLLAWEEARRTNQLPLASEWNTFVRTGAVKRVGPHEFNLYLNPGIFREHTALLQKGIELIWQSPPYRVRVIWSKLPNAFELELNPLESAHYVNYQTKKISILEFISPGTLAHEIGHVLGFADHYRYYWHEKSCQVNGNGYPSDIMANSPVAKTLRGHWLLLDKAYPYPPKKGLPESFYYRRTDVFKGEK